jgi:DNA-binding transcriptional MocR family regulator
MDGADLTLSERTMLIEQYRHGDRDGCSSFPSEKRMADNLSTSTKTVRDKRASLRAKGWLIERERGTSTGDNRNSAYDVVIPLGRMPAEKPKRKPNNPAGTNQYRKISSSKIEEEPSKKPRPIEEDIFHLPVLPAEPVICPVCTGEIMEGDDIVGAPNDVRHRDC